VRQGIPSQFRSAQRVADRFSLVASVNSAPTPGILLSWLMVQRSTRGNVLALPQTLQNSVLSELTERPLSMAIHSYPVYFQKNPLPAAMVDVART